MTAVQQPRDPHTDKLEQLPGALLHTPEEELPHDETAAVATLIEDEEPHAAEASAVRPRRKGGFGRQFAEILRSTVLWIGAVIGAGCILLFLLGMILGWRPQAVVSGSMEPSIPVGALVIVKEAPVSEIEVGDVVTVPSHHGDGLITHRVVEKNPAETGASLVLRGDANASADPDPYHVNMVGKMIFSVPLLGFFASLLKTPFGIAGIVIVALCIIAAFAWQPRRDRA